MNSIKFKIICIALFTKQSLQSSFKGNSVPTIDLYIAETLIYLSHEKMWFILYLLCGVGIIFSQVFGHLGSFKGWIQTEAYNS